MKWSAVSIGTVCIDTPQRDPCSEPDTVFHYVDLSAIRRESKQIAQPTPISGRDAPSRARKAIQADDVLVSTVRPNLNTVAIVPGELDGAIASTGFCVLRVDRSRVNPRFLFYRVQCDDFVQFLVDRVTGANYPAVSDRIVKDAILPLPPLPEQERIVRILDEAQELRRLRQQADRCTADVIPALFHDMFGDPATNLNGWPVTTIGNVCELINGRAFKPSEWDNEGQPIIRIQNLNDPTKPFNYYSGTLPGRFRVRPLDILLSWSGTPGTSFGCFRWQGPEGWLNQHIFNVKIKAQLDGEFFIHHVNAKLSELIEKAHGGVGLQHVTKGMLDSTKLMIPPLSLQSEFAARVAEVQALETQQAESRRRLDNLFQSLLHRAFRGEL